MGRAISNRCSAIMAADRDHLPPIRQVGYGARWQGDDPGVITTVIDVPQQTDLPFSPELSGQIRDVARQVMRALG